MAQAPIKLLSRAEVLELIGVTYPALWAWVRDGKFPPARKLNSGIGRGARIAWIEQDVVDWIRSRPLQRPKGSKVVA